RRSRVRITPGTPHSGHSRISCQHVVSAPAAGPISPVADGVRRIFRLRLTQISDSMRSPSTRSATVSHPGMAKRLQFHRPPASEVYCGVLFGALPQLTAAHVGLYWATVRDRFPRVETRPPLPPLIEQFGGPPVTMSLSFEVMDVPPTPRVWLFTENQVNLVQIQSDRFLYNWRKGDDDNATYPSYDTVIVEYEREFDAFRSFLSKKQLGELQLRQFEVSYVDQVSGESVKDLPGGLESVLVDHVPDRSRPRFLGPPEGIAWRSSYVIPDSLGRLHVTAQTGFRHDTHEPLL